MAASVFKMQLFELTDSYLVPGCSVVVSVRLFRRSAAGIRYVFGMRMNRDAIEQMFVKEAIPA